MALKNTMLKQMGGIFVKFPASENAKNAAANVAGVGITSVTELN